MFIYLIVNHVTGKYYVGQHKGNDLNKYLQQKFNLARCNTSSNSYLFKSMRKHSEQSAWSIHALLSDIETREELNEHERDFIAFLKSQDQTYGYNLCRGGEGQTGPISDSTRRKLSAAYRPSEVRREAAARVNKGNKYAVGQQKTEAWREAASRANKGNKHRLGKTPWNKGLPNPGAFERLQPHKTKETCIAGGRVAGAIARDSGQLAAITTYEVRAAGGRAVIEALKKKNLESGLFKRIFTPERQAKALHFRWHVKRNKPSPDCSFCAAGLLQQCA